MNQKPQDKMPLPTLIFWLELVEQLEKEAEQTSKEKGKHDE